MIDRPVVFLSSTMRNLRHLRETVGASLEQLGYEPVLMDRNPRSRQGYLSIKQMCLENVASADILVLVLDGTYGQPVEGEWLVKSEFYHAKTHGKPSYVFVAEDAINKFELACRHPKRSPKTYDLHPEVFRFLQELQASWKFTYRDVAQLAHQIQLRLAEHFAELLRGKSEAALIRVAHLVEKMNSLYRDGNYVQALLACGEVLRIDNDSADALLTRAVCRVRLHGMHDARAIKEGIADCSRVLSRDDKNYRARYNLANFKLLSADHKPSDVRADLRVLFGDFPEYEIYFKNDAEFSRMLRLRENWEQGGPRRRRPKA